MVEATPHDHERERGGLDGEAEDAARCVASRSARGSCIRQGGRGGVSSKQAQVALRKQQRRGRQRTCQQAGSKQVQTGKGRLCLLLRAITWRAEDGGGGGGECIDGWKQSRRLRKSPVVANEIHAVRGD
eukprot:349932-Chlamydomonas_euryale.AAC.8